MTIIEAINRTEAVKANQYTQEEKIRWLSILDGIVFKEVIETHENTEGYAYSGYNDSTSLSTQLLIAEPYAQQIYPAWLAAQIDLCNDEIQRYNNNMDIFQAAYISYTAWYNRTYMPITKAHSTTFCSDTNQRRVIFDRVRVENGTGYQEAPTNYISSPLENE